MFILLATALLLFACRQTNKRVVRKFVSQVRTASGSDVPATFARTAKALDLRAADAKTAEGKVEGKPITLYVDTLEMPDRRRSWLNLSLEASPRELTDALVTELGGPSGAASSGDPGWRLPYGTIVLASKDGLSDITYNFGAPDDTVEDSSHGRIPDAKALENAMMLAGWRLAAPTARALHFSERQAMSPLGNPKLSDLQITYMDEPARVIGIRAPSLGITFDLAAVSAIFAAINIRDTQAVLNAANQKLQATTGDALVCAAEGNYFAVAQRTMSLRPEHSVTLWRRPFAYWNMEIQTQCGEGGG
jgi:hypothetical protein